MNMKVFEVRSLLLALLLAAASLPVLAESQRYLVQDVVNVQIVGGVRQDRLSTNMDGLGDINGDGYGDLAVSTNQFVEDWRENYVYVVFGAAVLPATIDLLTPSQNTFVVNGGEKILRCTGVGDFDGDGLNDLVVTNPSKDIEDLVWAGEAIVIEGTDALKGEIHYSDIDPYVRIQGHVNNEILGNVLSRAGDVNGDGFSDLMMFGYPDRNNSIREVVVIYGGTDVPSLISTADLGSHGTVIHNAFKYDGFGDEMACAGDVNGDGFDDLLIGADARDDGADRAYLIYGGTDLPPVIEASSLGKYGMVIEGGSNSYLGIELSGSGDVNRDGLADLLLSRPIVMVGGVTEAGITYILFGSRSLPGTIDVRNLGNRGITISGVEEGEALGVLLAGPANWDGDQYQEIAIAPGVLRHEVYLMKGGEAYSSAGTVRVDQLEKVVIYDYDPITTSFPRNMTFIGDVNGDGYDDLAVANWNYDYGTRYGAGTVYVFYGGQFFPTATPTETPTLTPTPEDTQTPTITSTPTPSFTPHDQESFSGWILSGEGRVKITPEPDEADRE